MAVVETYYPAKNVIIRIHDDACLFDAEDIRCQLDDMRQISDEIIARKLRDGMTTEEIIGIDTK